MRKIFFIAVLLASFGVQADLTGPVTPTAGPVLAPIPNGTILCNSSGSTAAPGACSALPTAAFPALTGDCTTIAGALAVTCLDTNGVAFGTFATANTAAAPAITMGSGYAITPASNAGIVGVTGGTSAVAGSIGELQYVNCEGSVNAGTITVTIASPAVVTWTTAVEWNISGTYGVAPSNWTCPIVFTTTGALPTGITSGTTYYVIGASLSSLSFDLASTAANAIACTSNFSSCTGIVNTSGSQSGTQTGTMGAALTTGTWTAGAGIVLTAGDWDCSSVWLSLGATLTTSTGYMSGAGTSSTSQPSNANYSSVRYASSSTASPEENLVSPTVFQISASPISLYGMGQNIFGGGTATGAAYLRCRRMH